MATERPRRLAPWAFSIGAFVCSVGLIGLITFALYDSVTSAKVSEQQVRATTLAAELSNFLLATREPDGSSLLENPKDFSLAERPLGFVKMKRPFYAYLLNRANARMLTADKVNWEPPRPCLVELSATGKNTANEAAFFVQACFAVIPSELSSRYAYFTLRYPAQTITRHRPGANFASADRVVLTFDGDRKASIVLVFEPPTLATARYPSQIDRFAGIHEMSAFLVSSPDRALRQVNAQAFERLGDGDDRRNYVTIVGRIDASVLDATAGLSQQWPTVAFEKMKVGLEIFTNTGGEVNQVIKLAPGGVGRALVSLQAAYLASVPSRSVLNISQVQGDKRRLVWSSAELKLSAASRIKDWRQQVSDWWAPKLMAMVRYNPEAASIERPHRIPGPDGRLTATLNAPQVSLPGFATRAFGWLTAALLLAIVLVCLGAYAVYRLRSVTQLAWAMTSNNINGLNPKRYGRHRDEFSTLWRVLNSLYSRNRSHSKRLVERTRKEAAAKAKEVRLLQTRLELRQERLDAISHEIRSPLATLLVRTDGDEKVQSALKRIHNAIETIFDSASAEDGIQNQKVLCAPTDLASFLSRLVVNMNETTTLIRYEGADSDVWCSIDEFLFETVMNHLLDNAQRYKSPDSQILIRLFKNEETKDAVVEVFNEGPSIPVDRLKSVFLYRNTDRSTPQNKGIGLCSARAYLFGMKATISVENRAGGVVFVVLIPLL